MRNIVTTPAATIKIEDRNKVHAVTYNDKKKKNNNWTLTRTLTYINMSTHTHMRRS